MVAAAGISCRGEMGQRGGDRERAKSLAKNHIPSQAADQEKRPSILEKQWASEWERHKL